MPRNVKIPGLPASVPCKTDFSFASATTYGCGGVARAAFFPRNEQEAAELFVCLKNSGENFCVLGRGSNVLAQDGFYDGYVLSTCGLCGASLKKTEKGYVLNVQCGAATGSLTALCRREGASGLEFIAGIPASIGGLLYMNGGAGGRYMEDVVTSVKIVDDDIRELPRKDCCFAYKHSIMRDINCCILSAKLSLGISTPREVAKNISARLAARRYLPCGRSCGCVFENYCGVSAGKIIENAGLKGLRYGKAFVSSEHANFIINRGRFSADVYGLICRIKEEVYNKLGITLKEEVCYIGDFE